jgi:oxygen-independent coproporphyrinogen-3 oxidase
MVNDVGTHRARPGADAVFERNDLHAVMRLVTPGARARKSRSLLLYVHVPFCSSKCHFCDWVVGYKTRDLTDAGALRKGYVEALCQQIDAYGHRLQDLGYRVTNIYWGGGTPTRLEPAQLARVHKSLAGAFDLSTVEEHTAECSPETITAEHLEVLLRCGLNRISVGVQSFDDTILRRMGRAHDAAAAEAAIRLVRRAGIENFNIDVIVGFPGQDRDSCRTAVQRAIDLGVPHVSVYMFREFSTELVAVRQAGARGRAARASHAADYLAAESLLRDAGYEEYIVGYFSRAAEYRFAGENHYFSFGGDYFGFGAGASSTVGRCALKTGMPARYGDSQVRAYIEAPTRMVAGPLETMPDELYLSSYFKAFATREGIRFDRWNDQFGFDFQRFVAARPAVRQWFAEEEERGARFVTTQRGIALAPETWVSTMIWRH